MAKKEEGIYTTQGESEKLVGNRAIINGELAFAFVKDGKLLSYEPWDKFVEQMQTGPCLEFSIESN